MAIRYAAEVQPSEPPKPKADPAAKAPTKPPAKAKVPKAEKRAPYLSGKTAEKTKPWAAEGVSRRTWYRRKTDAKPKA